MYKLLLFDSCTIEHIELYRAFSWIVSLVHMLQLLELILFPKIFIFCVSVVGIGKIRKMKRNNILCISVPLTVFWERLVRRIVYFLFMTYITKWFNCTVVRTSMLQKAGLQLSCNKIETKQSYSTDLN